MRRSDREVTDPSHITEIMSRCEVLRLALNTGTVPYILPVSFGMEPDGLTLYIHGAASGTKYALIEKDDRASFEMDCTHGLVLDEEKHSCTMNYESVVGWGVLEELTEDADKRRALECIMRHYHAGDFFYNPAAVALTRTFRLRVQERRAKCRQKTR